MISLFIYFLFLEHSQQFAENLNKVSVKVVNSMAGDEEKINKILDVLLEEDDDIESVLDHIFEEVDASIIFDFIADKMDANSIVGHLIDTEKVTEEEILDCIDDDDIADYLEGQGYTIEEKDSKKKR